MTTMTPPTFTPAQWRDAVEGSATEIARYTLGLPGAGVGESQPGALTPAMVGAHIPMVGGKSFELAVVGTRESCGAIAGAILGMTAAELSPAMVADAIGELANQLAGGVKRRMAGSGGDLELGLPVFVNGVVEPTGRQSVTSLPTTFGAIEMVVVIVGPR